MPLKLSNDSTAAAEFEQKIKTAKSLEEIIATQRDEPNQENCIYLMKQDELGGLLVPAEKKKENDKFFSIKVRTIYFQ